MLLIACGMQPATSSAETDSPLVPFTADGRSTLEQLTSRYQSLSTDHGWQMETVYQYPGADAPTIRAWRTAHRGEALWILAGLHGEEPAGPNAIAERLPSIVELAASGVPIVVIPLVNPQAYRNNWRYPNTSERDWRKGGYSVGDAEYLLPDLATGERPRAAKPPGPETKALTEFVLRLAESYPPRLVLDLHEDELSTDGGYIYSQGSRAKDNPVGAEVIRLLRQSGNPRVRAHTLRRADHRRCDQPGRQGTADPRWIHRRTAGGHRSLRGRQEDAGTGRGNRDRRRDAGFRGLAVRPACGGASCSHPTPAGALAAQRAVGAATPRSGALDFRATPVKSTVRSIIEIGRER
jgi:hypothetical protein